MFDAMALSPVVSFEHSAQLPDSPGLSQRKWGTAEI